MDLQKETLRIAGNLSACSYEKLEAFVEFREKVVNQLTRFAEMYARNAEQQAKMQNIPQYDAVILSRMNALRIEAQDWISQWNQAKVQRNAYERYGVMDSILMDQK